MKTYTSVILSCALAYLSTIYSPTVYAAEEVSCECQQLACDPCSIKKSIKFYTDKCGPSDSKIKSCARPTCIPVEYATDACPVPPAANSGPRAPVVVKATAEQELVNLALDPASAGQVKVIHGSVSIVRKDGKKTLISQTANIYENESIESGSDGAALVNFEGGNKLHVHADTTVEVKEYKDPKIEASRKALLQLIKGKIRNQVEQKYNGKTSYYKVQTKSAVAGVRGTDFIMEHHEAQDYDTTVETFKGVVILSDLDETQSRKINRGEGATFKADQRDVKHGILSPVYQIDSERLTKIDTDSRVDLIARSTKMPGESAICEKPPGKFNQCAWHCTGNPAGSSKCRVDLPTVACVRQRCNGNGEWAEETRLSEGAATLDCPTAGYSVKDCDY